MNRIQDFRGMKVRRDLLLAGRKKGRAGAEAFAAVRRALNRRCSGSLCPILHAARVVACIAAVAVIGLLASGCRHVSPWERGALADPTMRADANPLGNMLSEHMWFSREAASGGRGVGGGGCGCN